MLGEVLSGERGAIDAGMDRVLFVIGEEVCLFKS